MSGRISPTIWQLDAESLGVRNRENFNSKLRLKCLFFSKILSYKFKICITTPIASVVYCFLHLEARRLG